MKKTLTVFALALVCSGAFAQFNKGRYLVGGSVGFSATTNKTKTDQATVTNDHSTSFNFSPDVGYFIIDNLAVGASLSLNVSSTKDEGTPVYKNNTSYFMIVPFARYYIDPGIFFQAHVGGGPASSKTTSGTTTTKTKFSTATWGIGAGYAYFLNDFIAIEPIISYQSNSFKYKTPESRNITSGIYFSIGVQAYLGPRN